MMKTLILVLCFAAVCIESKKEFELPAGTITCQIDSENRDECIKEAIQDMLPKLSNGLVSLGIPALEPFEVQSVNFNYKRGSNFEATGTLRNVRVNGASDAIIEFVKTNITSNGVNAEIKIRMPHTSTEGYYRTEGRFNNIKIKSKGFYNVSADDVLIVSRSTGVFEQHDDGETYLRLTGFNVIPTIGKMKFYATGLLADPELSRLTLEFLNQYWPHFYKDVARETREIWEPILLKEANKFLLTVPFRKMLYYSESKEE